MRTVTLAGEYARMADYSDHRGRSSAMLAIYAANRGDIDAATRFFFQAEQALRRSRPDARGCRHMNQYLLNRVRAHMALVREDYAEAALRAEAALASLEQQHAAQDVCADTHEQWRRPELHGLRARALAAQGNLLEAEAIIRPFEYLDRTRVLTATSGILLEQGRTDDALRVAHAALRTTRGRSCGAFRRAEAREALARALMVTGRNAEAREQYRHLVAELAPVDPETWTGRFAYTLDRGTLLAISGNPSTAFAVLEQVERRRSRTFPTNSKKTIETRALRGLALLGLERKEEALAAFDAEMPAAIEKWHDSVSRNVLNAGDLWRLRTLAAGYLRLLLERGDAASVDKSFTVSESVRERGIQRAYHASIARVLERGDGNASLIRSLQDTERLVENLREQLVVMAGSYGDLGALKRRLSSAQDALRTLATEVEARHPSYKSLVNPDPMSILDIQSLLGDDEALLSTFVSENVTYVWAIPGSGAARTAIVPLGRAALRARVAKLRRALAPEDVLTLGDIPPFDLDVAHELYTALLAPVWEGWQDAAHLIVIADGPLGGLPLGVLVTEAVRAPTDDRVLFDRYREVPWLINTLKLSRVPSASALVALRQRVRADASASEPFIGFGDPYFGADLKPAQNGRDTDGGLRRAQRRIVLREGPGTRAAASADLSRLRRLPETAREIVAVAEAVGADPAGAVYLRKAASESVLKVLSRTGRLARHRMIAFATHGLVPGDLDGLQRPALALSRPVEGDAEDGLLTTDDIIGLRLNADWAILSASNTAVDDVKDADAVAGLGRAFLYAGARALLVSNWPVHSASTQELMVTLFRRQAEHQLSRAAALRTAMLELIAEGALRDGAGKAIFSYAHPLFWAPFTLLGDGGG